MSEQEQERYEAELRRMTPAPLPDEFMARLRAAKPEASPMARLKVRAEVPRSAWWWVSRWLAPAMAVAIVSLLLVRPVSMPDVGAKSQPHQEMAAVKAAAVQMDEELVSSFEVVAKLPDGQPVRFRCRKWQDQLVVFDKNRGVEIESTRPRVEIVPVRFETY